MLRDSCSKTIVCNRGSRCRFKVPKLGSDFGRYLVARALGTSKGWFKGAEKSGPGLARISTQDSKT